MHRPIPDSYWVVDGLLLAGEYAGAASAPRARPKLDALLDAGIRSFFDLTEEGELLPYDDMLRELASPKAFTGDRRAVRAGTWDGRRCASVHKQQELPPESSTIGSRQRAGTKS
jgi:hypothetical protein